jgi:hypothetical protein
MCPRRQKFQSACGFVAFRRVVQCRPQAVQALREPMPESLNETRARSNRIKVTKDRSKACPRRLMARPSSIMTNSPASTCVSCPAAVRSISRAIGEHGEVTAEAAAIVRSIGHDAPSLHSPDGPLPSAYRVMDGSLLMELSATAALVIMSPIRCRSSQRSDEIAVSSRSRGCQPPFPPASLLYRPPLGTPKLEF